MNKQIEITIRRSDATEVEQLFASPSRDVPGSIATFGVLLMSRGGSDDAVFEMSHWDPAVDTIRMLARGNLRAGDLVEMKIVTGKR